MQCPHFENDKAIMFQELSDTGDESIKEILENPQQIFYVIMGKHPDGVDTAVMFRLWDITAKHISMIYTRAITGRR